MTNIFHANRFIPMYGMPNVKMFSGAGRLSPEQETAINQRNADLRHITGYAQHGGEMLKGLMLKLAAGYPRYTFCVMRTAGGSQMIGYHAGVTVFSGEEKLGIIWQAARDHCPCFAINSPSIENMLKRGNAIKTADVKRVVKEFAKHFKPAPVEQQFKERFDLTAHAAYMEVYNKDTEISKLENPLMAALKPYILANADKLLAEVRASGVGVPSSLDVSPLQGLLRERKEAAHIKNSHHQGLGTLVWVKGGEYVVDSPKPSQSADFSPRVLHSDELPSGVKRQVGLLKLIEVNTAAYGVGIRLSEDTFYVLNGMDGND